MERKRITQKEHVSHNRGVDVGVVRPSDESETQKCVYFPRSCRASISPASSCEAATRESVRSPRPAARRREDGRRAASIDYRHGNINTGSCVSPLVVAFSMKVHHG